MRETASSRTDATTYPLLALDRLDSVLALRPQGPIQAPEFLGEVVELAAMVPAHRYVINLCKDRYRFTVGFAAALLRGQISLLPPNETTSALERLATDYPDAYYLTDGGAADSWPTAVPTFAFPGGRFGPKLQRDTPAIPATQIAAVFFTSGSTGAPIAHPRSWGSLVQSTRAAGQRLAVSRFPDAALIGTVPHQHSYGLESTVMLALQHRFALHSQRPFFPADICSALAAAPPPRILVTTPIHLRALMSDAGPLPAVDLLISATAPLTPQLAAEAEERFAAPLHEIYGCSEAGQIATRRTTRTGEWQCLSQLRLRQDAGNTWVRGASIDAETRLQDAIELLSDDLFQLHGRTEDMINVAGKRTSLAHLNYHLNSIDGVRDGVFVMPAEKQATVIRLMAFVVAPGISAESILSALRQRIDAAFLPRPLCLVEALPRNALGKLPREDVAKMVEHAGE